MRWPQLALNVGRSILLRVLVLAALAGATAPALAQGRFDDLARAFAYDTTASLDVRQRDSTVVARAIVRDINYASPKGGRVPAYLVVPSGRGPFAGVVFVHWGQGNRSEFVSEALALAAHGLRLP